MNTQFDLSVSALSKLYTAARNIAIALAVFLVLAVGSCSALLMKVTREQYKYAVIEDGHNNRELYVSVLAGAPLALDCLDGKLYALRKGQRWPVLDKDEQVAPCLNTVPPTSEGSNESERNR